jgi:formylglycine-generating enzyme required for sulfatase activity
MCLSAARRPSLLAFIAASSGLLGGAAASPTQSEVALPAAPRNDVLEIVAAKSQPVPGQVEIPAGKAWIGSSEKEVEALLSVTPGYTRILDAQTPQHQMEVPTFWIGRYEVTNTEYLAFVEATGHQPPIHWADEKVLTEAAAAFAKTEQEKFEAAKAEGRLYERRKWAADLSPNPKDNWWAANWREVGYRIHEGEERYPVVYVTYEDVQAYCSWAGLRLPTEFEFQRAARKDSKSIYPWGDTWEDGKYANTTELRRSKPHTVGSFEPGVSPFGLYDLSGNAWEWTSSPYVPYPNFKQGKYNVKVLGKPEELSVAPAWDPNQRVVVGGAYEVDKVAARVPTRRGTARSQFTSGIGFRVAASSRVGVDKASLLVENVIRNAPARVDGVTYSPENVVALDRWRVGAPGIIGYDYVLFMPVTEMAQNNNADLEQASRVQVAQLGVFSSNIDMLEPELPAGSYFIGYRAKGKVPRPPASAADKDKEAGAEGGTEKPQGDKPKADKGKTKKAKGEKADEKDPEGKDKDKDQEQEPAKPEAAPADPLLEGLDLDKDWLFFIRLDGTRAAAVSPEKMGWEKGNAGGTFKIRTGSERIGSGAAAINEPRTYLDLEANLIGKLRGQALPLKLSLRPSAAAFGLPWRQ